MSRTDKTAPHRVKKARGEAQDHLGYCEGANQAVGRPGAYKEYAKQYSGAARTALRTALGKAKHDEDTDVLPPRHGGLDWDVW